MSIAGIAEQKKRALQKIEELKKRKAELTEELRKKEEFNKAAWEKYGSELCAGEMVRNEQKIEDAIRAIDKDIALLVGWVKAPLDQQIVIQKHRAHLKKYSDLLSEFDRKRQAITAKLNKQERLEKLLELE